MKQTKQKQFNSFALSTDFFDHDTTLCIGSEFGPTGILVALRLLCDIHRSGYYLQYTPGVSCRIARDIPGLDRASLNHIIDRLIHWGMFDAETFRKHSVLTSIDIQRQYFKTPSRRHSAQSNPATPYLLLDLNTLHTETTTSAPASKATRESTPPSDNAQSPVRATDVGQNCATDGEPCIQSQPSHNDKPRSSATTKSTYNAVHCLSSPHPHARPQRLHDRRRTRTVPIRQIFRQRCHAAIRKPK